MKKIYALAIAAIAAIGGSAQAADGLYVGGNVGFWHESGNGNEASTNEFSIIPEIGYNLNSKWAVGTTIGIDHKHWCGAEKSNTMFEFYPYSRYTFYRSSANKVQLFCDGTVGIGVGTTSQYGVDNTAVTWGIGLKPGVAFNVTEHFSVVAHVGFFGYEGANKHAKAAGYHDQGGLKFDTNNLQLGFYYNF